MSVGFTRLSLRRTPVFAAVIAALALAACSSGQRGPGTGTISEPGGPKATESKLPEGVRRSYAKGGAVGGRARVRVNQFAWQASLDSVAFMPIKTSDPYGGLIATDWYRPSTSPNERLRVNILVGGPQLTSDTVRVTVFKEVQDKRGNWRPIKVNPRTSTDLENVILSRARQARLAANR
jgi:hypothetical protein